MRSQIRGLRRAEQNTEDGISFIQTAEGYLQETQDILQRLRELAIQASNGIYSTDDRVLIQVEVSQLIDEVDRIASHAQFNGMNILTGRFARPTGENSVTGSMWFHIGPNMDQRERAYLGTMSAQGLGLKNPADPAHAATFISISTPAVANRAIGAIDQALMKVSKQRADLGAYQNRLEYAAKGLMAGYENMQAAESRIRDSRTSGNGNACSGEHHASICSPIIEIIQLVPKKGSLPAAFFMYETTLQKRKWVAPYTKSV